MKHEEKQTMSMKKKAFLTKILILFTKAKFITFYMHRNFT